MRMDETNEHGHAVSREILCSFHDAYMSELLKPYSCLTEAKEIKISAEDAYQDLRLFDMMYKTYEAD